MNRSHREEGQKEGRGPGLIGEKTEKTSSYDHAGWGAVDKMLKGEHPTTNIATVACASSKMGHYKNGGSVENEQRKMVEGRVDHMRDNMKNFGHAKKGGSMKQKFAQGGVGKVRKGEY